MAIYLTKYLCLENLPLNINGKLDSKQLLNNLPEFSEKILKATNPIEEKLVEIWEEILSIKDIGINQNFFELGGDSLTAIDLCARIHKIFNVQLFVKDILDNPVIKDLSDLISSKEKLVNNISIKKVEIAEYYPVSSAQKRTYYSTKKISENNLVYNVSGALLIDKLLDINKIKNAFLEILKLHPSFRTRFVLKDDELVQEIVEIENIDIDIFEGKEKDINKIINEFPKPFDLSIAPLLRVAVCILDNKKTLILLDSHHIIVDGVSLNILFRDFCKLYNDEEVQESDFNYIDYAVWENDYINNSYIRMNPSCITYMFCCCSVAKSCLTLLQPHGL